MRKILAIGLNLSLKEKQKIKDKLSLDDVILHTNSIKDLVFEIINNKLIVSINNRSIDNYDYIWIQSGWNTTHVAFLLDKYLRSKHIPHNKTYIRQSKISDIFMLTLKDIPTPNTFFQCGRRMSIRKIRRITKTCGLPCIYKTVQGSLGSDVYLIKDKESLIDTLRNEKESFKFMFQKYIPNNFDYRVLVANNEPYSICRRVREQREYRNNTALGATEIFISTLETPKEIIDMAIKSTKALNLKWAGVDIVTDSQTGKNYVLEVNRRPGLTKGSPEITAAYKFVTKLTGL